MTTHQDTTTELRALELGRRDEGKLISVQADGPHCITGRLSRARTQLDGLHLSRIILEIEIDLGPGLFTCCTVAVNGDYPVAVGP